MYKNWNDSGFNTLFKKVNLRVPMETGKVMEHAKLAKSHDILISVMEFYQFCPGIVPNLYVCLPPLKKIKHGHRKSTFSTKCLECKIKKRDGHGNLRNGHEEVITKIMDKYFVIHTLFPSPHPHTSLIPTHH